MTTADVLPHADVTPEAPPASPPEAPPEASRPARRWPARLAGWSAGGVVVGWLVLAGAVVFVSQLSNTMWALGNPAPHHWDNADYLNFAYRDYWASWFGGPSLVGTPPHHMAGWRGVYDLVINADPNRPPGYRVVSLPFIFLGTRMLPTLRAVSLLVFWATLWVTYRTAAVALPGPAGRASGAAAALLLSIYLEVGWSVRVYGTEYTLYFAVALMLWCFARAARPDLWAGGRRPGWTWVWLGLALGLGILSKMSFLFLAGPVGLLVLVLSIARRLPGLPLGRLVGAGIIGLVMAFPWYRYHLFTAYHYGQDMTQFSRHSLHKHGLDLVAAWFTLHANEGVGPRAGGILVGLGVLGVFVAGGRWWQRVESGGVQPGQLFDWSPAGWTVLIALAQGLPLLAFQVLFSSSDNTRHMTPAYLPVTMAAAVGAGMAGVLSAWWAWPVLVAAAVPAVQQVGHDFVPYTNTPDDVWDWDPVYQICQRHGLRFPFIGRVGNAGQFNEPSITAPWARRGDMAFCAWLWRKEDGGFDWPAVEAELADRQVVLTAPRFAVPSDHSMLADPLQQDNAYNQAFADHMLHEPGWLPPEKFDIGVVNKATVWVFVRKK